MARVLLCALVCASCVHCFVPPSLPGKAGLQQTRPQITPLSMSAVTERRSVVKYDGAAPEGAVTSALEAAILAPNHFLSEPWRFYVLGPDSIGKIKGLNEEKAKMFDGVPGWMAVTLASEHDVASKLWLEDHAAVACAIQNFCVSLAADGVGSKWMTGALGIAPDAIQEALAIPEGEHFMGMVWYGMPAKALGETKAPPRKKGLDGTLTKLA